MWFLLSLRHENTSDRWRRKEETSRGSAHHQRPSCLVLYFQRPPTLPLAPAFLLLQCKRKEKHVSLMEAVGLCGHSAFLTLRFHLLSLLTCWAHLPLTTSWEKYCWYCGKIFLLRFLVWKVGYVCLKEMDPSRLLDYQGRNLGGLQTKWQVYAGTDLIFSE